MTPGDIAKIRLFSQQIATTKFRTVKDIVGWMGAMQAQDYSMAKWAIGARLPGSTEKMVNAAIDKGEIIRTHLLRPTWHFVAADDIHWMLELTAPRIRASLKPRHKELGLEEAVLSKSNKVIERSLTGKKHLTREELVAELQKAGISTGDNRASHLFLWAELNGIICSGSSKDTKQTYALLEERVPKTKMPGKEEALAKLAQRYFLSHGPATLQDFIWWSGLPASAARQALEMVKEEFVSETIGQHTYWFGSSFSPPGKKESSVYMLPAYDEFIISYRDRSAALGSEDHKRSVSANGIFKPVILVNGQVTGLWKRTVKKDRVIVETVFFRPHGKTVEKLMEKASRAFGLFLGKRTEISHQEHK